MFKLILLSRGQTGTVPALPSITATGAPGAGGLQVREVIGRGAFRGLEAEWDALVEETNDQPFYRHGFLRIWIELPALNFSGCWSTSCTNVENRMRFSSARWLLRICQIATNAKIRVTQRRTVL